MNFFGFKKIPGFGCLYLVNEYGEVFSIKTMKLLTHQLINNYHVVKINGRMRFVHRLVLMAFRPINKMEKMQVNHKDKNTSNNHITNLEWTTPSENILWNRVNKTKSFNRFKRKIARIATLKGEIWKDVSGYGGLYQVSNLGRIKSVKLNSSGKIKGKEYLFRCSPRSDGYCRVELKRNGVGKSYYAHRLIAKAFLPNPKRFPQVNHVDGNKANNKAANLEWVSALQNKQHSLKVLKKQVGEDGSNSKLKESDVRKIQHLYFTERLTYEQIASLYNIHYTTIGYIVKGKLWKHIKVKLVATNSMS